MQPLVSILIPAYNAAPWIEASVESALAQDHRACEIIVADDGSTDDTLGIAQRFASRGVRILTQTNRGAAAARNLALSKASGDLIQFLDADDLLAPEKVARQVALLDGDDRHVASCEWARFRDTPSEARFQAAPAWADLDGPSWLVCSWSGGGMMHPAAWLVPRRVADLVGPWDERLSLADDLEYFARVLLASDGVRFCAGARTYYRSGLTDSLSGRRSDRALESGFLATQLGTSALLARENSERTRRAAATMFQRFAFDAFPLRRDLAEKAAAQASALGGTSILPGGGAAFETLARLAGWRTALRARQMAFALGYGGGSKEAAGG